MMLLRNSKKIWQTFEWSRPSEKMTEENEAEVRTSKTKVD